MLRDPDLREASTLPQMPEPNPLPVTVGLVAEQLLQRPSGGIGAYIRGLIGTLPASGVCVRGATARHDRTELANAGIVDPAILPLPRTALYESWSRIGWPSVAGDLDLVHATSLAFPYRERRPLVVTVHDLLFRTFPHTYTARGVAWHERGVRRLSAAAAVLCPSEATAEEVRSLPGVPATIRVTPLGCDLVPIPADEVPAVLSRWGITQPYVLWLGTREPRKNVATVVEAFAHVLRCSDVDPATILVLAGPPGWGDTGVESAATTTGVLDRIIETGYVSPTGNPPCTRGRRRSCSHPWPKASAFPCSRPWPAAHQ